MSGNFVSVWSALQIFISSRLLCNIFYILSKYGFSLFHPLVRSRLWRLPLSPRRWYSLPVWFVSHIVFRSLVLFVDFLVSVLPNLSACGTLILFEIRIHPIFLVCVPLTSLYHWPLRRLMLFYILAYSWLTFSEDKNALRY